MAKSGNITMKITDLLGNKVIQLMDELVKEGEYNYSIDCSTLPSGLYLLNYSNADKSGKIKFVIAR